MRETATWWHHQVFCQECDYQYEGRNGLGLAAQHHDRTGHTVVTDVHGSVCYGEDVGGDPSSEGG